MHPNDLTLSLGRLFEALSYDPVTGDFTWLIPGPAKGGGGRMWPGKIAGSRKPSGYVCINIDGKRYRAHRLAWMYMTGAPPNGQIDHIDLNRSNNVWTNLRLADATGNAFNTPASRNNKSGYKGVYLYKGRPNASPKPRWRAKINVGPRQIHIGTFDTAEEAHAAYECAARRYAGEFARAA